MNPNIHMFAISYIPNYIHMFAILFCNCCSFGVFLPLAPPLPLVGALCALFWGIWSYGNDRMDREIISCVQQKLSLTWYSSLKSLFLKNT